MKLERFVRLALFALLAAPVVAAAQTAYTGRDVNVRAGPDKGYPLVAWLPSDTPVNVYGCLDGYTWCDVSSGPNRGWVYANFLYYPYASGQVPIYTYGPQLNIPLIAFSLGTYWGSYYAGRPWYSNQNYWSGYRPPPPRPPPHYRPPPYPGGHPPGWRPPPPLPRPPGGGGGYKPPPGGGKPPATVRPPGGVKPPGGGGGGRPPGGGGGKPPGGGAGGGKPPQGGGGGGPPPRPNTKPAPQPR